MPLVQAPIVLLLGHAILIAVGILFLAGIGKLIEIMPLSETVKHVAHVIDDFLLIFAFVVIGIGFIIKMATIALGGGRHD